MLLAFIWLNSCSSISSFLVITSLSMPLKSEYVVLSGWLSPYVLKIVCLSTIPSSTHAKWDLFQSFESFEIFFSIFLNESRCQSGRLGRICSLVAQHRQYLVKMKVYSSQVNFEKMAKTVSGSDRHLIGLKNCIKSCILVFRYLVTRWR